MPGPECKIINGPGCSAIGLSDEKIAKLEISELDLYEQLLSKDDHLIYSWLFKKEESPKIFKILVEKIQESMNS